MVERTKNVSMTEVEKSPRRSRRETPVLGLENKLQIFVKD